LTRKSYIIFSSINWSTHWQIHHQLDKLFGDECYSSAKIEALGFRAKKTLKDMNKTSF